jgi:hypothetical protein
MQNTNSTYNIRFLAFALQRRSALFEVMQLLQECKNRDDSDELKQTTVHQIKSIQAGYESYANEIECSNSSVINESCFKALGQIQTNCSTNRKCAVQIFLDLSECLGWTTGSRLLQTRFWNHGRHAKATTFMSQSMNHTSVCLCQ